MEATPPGFVFAVKANMRITHILRLKNAGEATELFFKMIDPLRTSRRLGPVLFQLPPAMKCDVALLRDYLDLLPEGMRYAFEFRHPSLAGGRGLRRAARAQCLAVRGRIGEAGGARGDHGGFRLLPPAQARLHARRTSTPSPRGPRNCWRPGRDLYLMFKHEETPEGALNAEMLLKRQVQVASTSADARPAGG